MRGSYSSTIPFWTRQFIYVFVSKNETMVSVAMGYTYAGQIFLDTKTFEIATAEDDGAKVLSYRLVETLGRSHGHGYV